MMKKILLFILLIFLIGCSDGDNDTEPQNESRIEVTINGTQYIFNTFLFEKYFEDPNDKYYYVIAKIDNSSDLVFDFDITIGITGSGAQDWVIGELNLFSNSLACPYYGVDVEYPLINTTINNEMEFYATFEFNQSDVINNGPNSSDCMFGDYVNYTNGVIHLYL